MLHPGGKKERCAAHKGDGMVELLNHKCSHHGCNKRANFGLPGGKKERCAAHKGDGMVDLITKKCHGCELFIVRSNTQYLCRFCNPNSALRKAYDFLLKEGKKLIKHTIKRGVKEKEVVIHLGENLEDMPFLHDRSVGEECGRYRPDILLETIFNGCHYYVIVEVDEHQHRSYDCEEARMLNIWQACLAPCVFIRYNPDGFKDADGVTRSVSKADRLEQLVKKVNEMLEQKPKEDSLCVTYLFYDGGDVQEKVITGPVGF